MPSQSTTAFKILSALDWQSWKSTGIFTGASIDITDGYIHLSTASQAAETYHKYFEGQPDLVLCEVDLEMLKESVKWEESRGGQLFPHVYGAIKVEHIAKVKEGVTAEIMDQLAEKGLA
ncbi:DUF952-domain-containing protein [Aulographum hederae CBS 113979]|uniref:DUF952-domain-containing protein n=1 Tax=Aulographum hederae CBS 113979 TaxID=1176131 RepID=A0A6G1GM68_9PEZI|nr:DUF952-domain-containing protein [Aulographum hederae CBS 113979]